MIDLLGYVAALLTCSSFIPQAIHTIKTRDTSGISLWMYILFVTGILLWFIYGIILNATPIIYANGFTGILAAIILFYKITEPKSEQASS